MTARGKKPKVVKPVVTRGWALKRRGELVGLSLMTKRPSFMFTDDDGVPWPRAGAVVRVEIREIPRKRKPTVTRATDAASRVWWADVDRAAKSAQALRDKPKRKGKRT